MLGQILGDYELQQDLGRGSVATVYVARQHPVERYVALKLFDAQPRDVTTRLRQLFDELADLDHTHILPLYTVDRWQDHLYTVTRYMPAGSLHAKLHSQRLTLEEIDLLLPEIAAALEHAHGHGLFHGDLKPTDLLLDHAGHAFVADLGLAATLGRTSSPYQAPEVRRGGAYDARGDVYCLGVVLYELLTGRLPLEPRDAEEKTNRRLIPPAPSTIVSRLPAALDAVTLKALSVDPDQRYATPGALAEDYAQARSVRKTKAVPAVVAAAALSAAQPGSQVRRVSPRRSSAARGSRWRLIGFIGGAIVALAMIITLGLVIVRSPAAVAPIPSVPPVPPSIISPTLTSSPTPIAALSPTATATPANTVQPTATPTSTAQPTLTATPTRAVTRAFFTPTPAISIAPLTLALPRSDGSDSLSLTFNTTILPADAGVIGTLSLSVPGLESLVIAQTLAQVSSGEQVLVVGLHLNCGLNPEPLTSRQILLTIRDTANRVLLSQSMDYVKRWCY